MSTFDRDGVIEQAARAAWDSGSPLSLKRWDELPEDVRAHSVEREYAADMLPVIVDAALAPIEALVSDWQANGNSRELGDPTAAIWQMAARQLLDALAEIKAATR